MTSFIRELQNGREPNGDEIKKFQQQLRALAKARINLGVIDNQRSLDGKLDIVESFDVWFSKDARQRVLWTSTVELSQKYFDTLVKHAVPLDPRGIAALSHSALALDLYTWLAQRLHRIGSKPELATWANLQEQLGDSYKEIRMLRRAVNNALADVKTQYPDAHFETDQRGITLFNSPRLFAAKWCKWQAANHGYFVTLREWRRNTTAWSGFAEFTGLAGFAGTLSRPYGVSKMDNPVKNQLFPRVLCHRFHG